MKVPKFAASAETLVGRLDRRRAGGVREPEEIFQLANDDGHRNTRREARGDGIRNKADDGAQLEQAHNHEQHAGDKRRRHQAVDAVGRDNAGHDGRERRRRSRDLHARAAEERDKEACDDGRVQALFRADAEAIASAIESGSATMATTMPDTMSRGSCSLSSSLLECLMMLNRIGLILSRCKGSQFLFVVYRLRRARRPEAKAAPPR